MSVKRFQFCIGLLLAISLSVPAAASFPWFGRDKTPPSTSTLTNQLKSPDAKERAKAARELGKNGDASAVPALASALMDPSTDVRQEVVVALSQIHTPASLNALISATRDTDPDVRLLAVRGVTGYYTGQSLNTGFQGFLKRAYKHVKSHFVPSNLTVDPGTLVNPQVVSALVKVMSDTRSIEPAREAAKSLGILLARSAVPDLVKAAHSNDADLTLEALNSLAKIKDRSAGPQLVDLLNSPNQDVMRNAALTVGILRTRQAVPKLQAIFENDSDQKDREAAIQGLAFIGDPVSNPIFTKALWSDDKAIRTSAAEGFARSADAKALPDLQKAMSVEKDEGVQLALDYAFAAIGKVNYIPDMVNELDSKRYRDVARSYLIELARNPKYLSMLYPFLSVHDATIRKNLCTVLVYSGNQSSIPYLERLSRDSDGDVAAEALRALRAIRYRSSGTA